MEFTEDELTTLNTYLNSQEDLPVDVAVINVKLRDHFEQDNSVEAPEVAQAVAEDAATPSTDSGTDDANAS